jgi:hypothetical protein
LRALVERGLQQVVSEKPKPYRMRDASVDGKGLSPDVAEGGWDEIRRLAYEGHGG